MIKWSDQVLPHRRKNRLKITALCMAGMFAAGYLLMMNNIWQDYRIVNQETLAAEAYASKQHMECLDREIMQTLTALDAVPIPSKKPPRAKLGIDGTVSEWTPRHEQRL